MTAINGSTPMPAQTMLPGQQTAGLNVPGGTDPSTYVPGVTVTGQAGSTTLPNGTVADYANPATDPGLQPDATYPALMTTSVLIFQAMGTPKELLDQLNAEQPDPAFVEDYLLNQVLPNPEAWDARCGNPAGTARAGLAQIFPDAYGDPAQYQTSSTTSPEGANTTTTPGATFGPAEQGGLLGMGTAGNVAGFVGAAAILGGTGYLAFRSGKKKAGGAADVPKGVAELSRQLGGGPEPARGTEGTTAANRLKGILALDSRKGSLGDQMRNFHSGGSLETTGHPLLDHLSDVQRGAAVPLEDMGPLAKFGEHYGVAPMDMWKFALTNNLSNGLNGADRANLAMAALPETKEAATKVAAKLDLAPLTAQIEKLGVEKGAAFADDLAKLLTKLR